MKTTNKYTILTALLTTLVVMACTKKPGEGFLGNQFYYLANPFTGIKGRVTTSVPIQADGSSNPLNVQLLEMRNRAGQVTALLSKEYEIPIYKGEVTPADSTPELLANKLGTAMYKPFNVNSIGGRLELTPATAYVDTGYYDFDIQVSNIAGAKTIKSVAKVILTPSVPSQLIRQFANTSAPNQELVFTTQANFSVTLDRKDGPNIIIIKFVDKNGATFNPKTGEVQTRVGTDAAPRYGFKQFAPYYAEEKTDTALVYKYPAKTPTFPLFMLNNAYLSSYRIPAANNDLNQNINPELAFRLYPTDGVPFVSGTWTITNKISFAARK
ncbi:MAG: hypothetical protein V4450_15335 [Bacteroidota bacterium]